MNIQKPTYAEKKHKANQKLQRKTKRKEKKKLITKEEKGNKGENH